MRKKESLELYRDDTDIEIFKKEIELLKESGYKALEENDDYVSLYKHSEKISNKSGAGKTRKYINPKLNIEIEYKEGNYLIKSKRLTTTLYDNTEQLLYKKDAEYNAKKEEETWFVTNELGESNAYSNNATDGFKLEDFYSQFEVLKEDDSI